MLLSARQTAQSLVVQALHAAVAAGELPAYEGLPAIERPKRPEHGDFATNVALSLTKAAGQPPRAIAEILAIHLRDLGGADLSEAHVAGPGFLNLRFSDAYWQRALGAIIEAGPTWGQNPDRATPRILLEYLSANPTGPLHFAHGRHAAVGDSLARLLRFAGHRVTTEFYLNDAGNQVAMLALSVWSRYMEVARATTSDVPVVVFPDNGYRGEYIRGIAQSLWERDGRRWVGPTPPVDIEPIRSFAIAACLGMIQGTLATFQVAFDHWQSERALHESGDVANTLAALDKAGFIDRHDDAVWLRTTALWGDDKDRVVVKNDGLPTYLLADVAYHLKKFARGFDDLCDIWGSDHHGHIARMKAALKAFGHDPERLSVILIQMVSLVRDGKPIAMGKREGEFITLQDVVDEVGRDATRFFYLMRRHDTPLEFDLELAKRQSMDNPVYYVQYAHARCASILERAAVLQAPRPALSAELLQRLTLPEEIALLRRLSSFPDFVADAAAAREPHRLTTFAQELAGEFQSYYTRLQKDYGDTILPQTRHRVGNWQANWDWDKTAARLAWVEAIRQVLANALSLLGVSAPQKLERPAVPQLRESATESASDELED